jgi:hypothetical protein
MTTERNPDYAEVAAENEALRNALKGVILNVQGLAENAERVLWRAQQAIDLVQKKGEDLD